MYKVLKIGCFNPLIDCIENEQSLSKGPPSKVSKSEINEVKISLLILKNASLKVHRKKSLKILLCSLQIDLI